MAYLLKKEDLPLFLKLLMKSYDVAAPIVSNKITVYSDLTDPGQVTLTKNTCYPPKKYFLPPKETLFSYRRKRTILRTRREVAAAVFETRKKVIFGMRMCDVAAIATLDRFFVDDPHYHARRENIYIIALKCNAEENDNCFCSSFKYDDIGYDLYFERTAEGFIVDVKTENGKGLVDKKIFKSSVREVNKGVPDCRKKLQSHTIVADSPVWKTYSEKCLSCSACNSVCPSCTCFDMKDIPSLDLATGERIRLWDYCQSLDFSRIAGGIDFRKDRTARYKHRLLCKFKYSKDNQGESCTGCGRCITACPTKVCDIPKIMGEL